jgi:hypothetical protein
MRRTRRSGSTAGEALPLQLHIAGPQKGVGPFSRGRALAACAGHCYRPSLPPATRSAVLCLRTGGVTWATRRRRGRRSPRSRSRRRSPSRRGHAIEHELRVGALVVDSGSRCVVVRPTRDTTEPYQVIVAVPSPPRWEDRLEGLSHVSLTARGSSGFIEHVHIKPLARQVPIRRRTEPATSLWRRPISGPHPHVTRVGWMGTSAIG